MLHHLQLQHLAPAAVVLFSGSGSSAFTSLTSAWVSIMTMISKSPWIIQENFEITANMLTNADMSDAEAEEPVAENNSTAAGANAEAEHAEALEQQLSCFVSVAWCILEWT